MQNRCIDVTIMHWRYVSFALSHLSGLSSNFIYTLIMQDIVTSWWRYETVMFFTLLAKVDLLSPMESLYKEAVLIFDVYFVGNPNIILKNKANLRDLIAATGLVISNWIQIVNFSTRVTVKFDGWPCKTIGHLFYATSSFVHHFVPIGEFKFKS